MGKKKEKKLRAAIVKKFETAIGNVLTDLSGDEESDAGKGWNCLFGWESEKLRTMAAEAVVRTFEAAREGERLTWELGDHGCDLPAAITKIRELAGHG
jgi:hypothetical protein